VVVCTDASLIVLDSEIATYQQKTITADQTTTVHVL